MAAPDDPELRDSMMLASLEAGLAFSNASLGAVHALAHSLGGLLDLPHGECNAILLAPVIAYNFGSAAERYRLVAEQLGLDTANHPDAYVKAMLLDDITALKESVGISVRLGERGMTVKDLGCLAHNAIHDPCMVTNPRIPEKRELEELYAGTI